MDRTLEKVVFYATVGSSELLVIDRDPWQLTMYRLSNNKKLVPVAFSSSSSQQTIIRSDVLPICLQLQLNPPCIRLTHVDQSLIREIPIRLK